MSELLLGFGVLMVTIILVLLKVDVAYAFFSVSVLWLIFAGEPWRTIPSRAFAGLDSFILVAVPFFILAAEVMNRAKITETIIQFSNLVVGGIRGGLAYVNLITSLVFGGISGSAVADTAAIGSVFVPHMEERGYSIDYSAAITVWSSLLGPLVPPSIIAVIYASLTSTNVGALFAASILPSMVLFLLMLIFVRFTSGYYDLPEGTSLTERRSEIEEGWLSLGSKTAAALGMPGIILGGIFGGFFTPTEAAVVACFYAVFVGMFLLQSLDISDISDALGRTITITSQLFLIIAASAVFSYMIALEGITDSLTDLIVSMNLGAEVFMIVVGVFMLFVGMWIGATAILIILAPTLADIAGGLAIPQLQFGVFLIFMSLVGLLTPPFGIGLFTIASVTDVELENLYKQILPFALVNLILGLLLVFIPDVSLLLPRILGY